MLLGALQISKQRNKGVLRKRRLYWKHALNLIYWGAGVRVYDLGVLIS